MEEKKSKKEKQPKQEEKKEKQPKQEEKKEKQPKQEEKQEEKQQPKKEEKESKPKKVKSRFCFYVLINFNDFYFRTQCFSYLPFLDVVSITKVENEKLK